MKFKTIMPYEKCVDLDVLPSKPVFLRKTEDEIGKVYSLRILEGGEVEVTMDIDDDCLSELSGGKSIAFSMEIADSREEI